jgi:hypothetical protein
MVIFSPSLCSRSNIVGLSRDYEKETIAYTPLGMKVSAGAIKVRRSATFISSKSYITLRKCKLNPDRSTSGHPGSLYIMGNIRYSAWQQHYASFAKQLATWAPAHPRSKPVVTPQQHCGPLSKAGQVLARRRNINEQGSSSQCEFDSRGRPERW